MHSIRWIQALALGLWLTGPLARAQADPRHGTVLADFEDSTHDALLTASGNPTAALSSEFASQGKRSLRMAFDSYVEGAPQWPAFTVELEEMGASGDWRRFSELLMDLHVQSADDVLVKVPLRSGTDGRWVGARTVRPGEWTTVRFSLAEAASALDLGSMTALTVVLTRPPHPAVIHLDNIRLHAFELSDPECVDLLLLTPSYHNAFFHTKPEETISVRLTPRTTVDALDGASFLLTVSGQGGAALASRELAALDLVAETTVSLPKPSCRDGDTLTLRLEARRGGAVFWHKDIRLVQHPRAEQEITLRDDGVTLVNGQPFFPFGMYSSPITEFAYLREMGFNSVHSYSPVDAAYMEAARAAGVRVLARLRGSPGADPHIYHDPDKSPDKAVEYIRSLCDSPALLGYYLFDEPNPGTTPRDKLKALCDLVRREDPYHLATGCNNSYQAAYYRVSDAMMVDSYPVPGSMAQLLRRMREGAAAQGPNHAVWFIPQAFNYETHFTHPLRGGRDGLRRLPTFDEVRTMPWLGICLGARGLFYYSFQTQGFYHRDAFPWFWRGFRHHVRETAALLPWLTARELEPGPASSNAYVLVAARRRGDDLLLVAANALREEAEATLILPGLAGRTLYVVSESRTVRPDGDSFPEAFAALETHVYLTRLDGATADLPALAEIRAEACALLDDHRRANPSAFTYRDGARLTASWGFPDPDRFRRNIWYRMIDGFPGTQWTVGNAYHHPDPAAWKEKDFSSAGRWVEVRRPEATEVNRLRAVLTPGIRFELQLPDGDGWRTLEVQTVSDSPPRHHQFPSATTTAAFESVRTDRFRVLFTEARTDREVVFELSAWRE